MGSIDRSKLFGVSGSVKAGIEDAIYIYADATLGIREITYVPYSMVVDCEKYLELGPDSDSLLQSISSITNKEVCGVLSHLITEGNYTEWPVEMRRALDKGLSCHGLGDIAEVNRDCIILSTKTEDQYVALRLEAIQKCSSIYELVALYNKTVTLSVKPKPVETPKQAKDTGIGSGLETQILLALKKDIPSLHKVKLLNFGESINRQVELILADGSTTVINYSKNIHRSIIQDIQESEGYVAFKNKGLTESGSVSDWVDEFFDKKASKRIKGKYDATLDRVVLNAETKSGNSFDPIIWTADLTRMGKPRVLAVLENITERYEESLNLFDQLMQEHGTTKGFTTIGLPRNNDWGIKNGIKDGYTVHEGKTWLVPIAKLTSPKYLMSLGYTEEECEYVYQNLVCLQDYLDFIRVLDTEGKKWEGNLREVITDNISALLQSLDIKGTVFIANETSGCVIKGDISKPFVVLSLEALKACPSIFQIKECITTDPKLWAHTKGQMFQAHYADLVKEDYIAALKTQFPETEALDLSPTGRVVIDGKRPDIFVISNDGVATLDEVVSKLKRTGEVKDVCSHDSRVNLERQLLEQVSKDLPGATKVLLTPKGCEIYYRNGIDTSDSVYLPINWCNNEQQNRSPSEIYTDIKGSMAYANVILDEGQTVITGGIGFTNKQQLDGCLNKVIQLAKEHGTKVDSVSIRNRCLEITIEGSEVVRVLPPGVYAKNLASVERYFKETKAQVNLEGDLCSTQEPAKPITINTGAMSAANTLLDKDSKVKGLDTMAKLKEKAPMSETIKGVAGAVLEGAVDMGKGMTKQMVVAGLRSMARNFIILPALRSSPVARLLTTGKMGKTALGQWYARRKINKAIAEWVRDNPMALAALEYGIIYATPKVVEWLGVKTDLIEVGTISEVDEWVEEILKDEIKRVGATTAAGFATGFFQYAVHGMSLKGDKQGSKAEINDGVNVKDVKFD